jgi:hypothetical protein
VFTARYALSPYIKQIRFVFKGLIIKILSLYCVETASFFVILFYYMPQVNKRCLCTVKSNYSSFKLKLIYGDTVFSLLQDLYLGGASAVPVRNSLIIVSPCRLVLGSYLEITDAVPFSVLPLVANCSVII